MIPPEHVAARAKATRSPSLEELYPGACEIAIPSGSRAEPIRGSVERESPALRRERGLTAPVRLAGRRHTASGRLRSGPATGASPCLLGSWWRQGARISPPVGAALAFGPAVCVGRAGSGPRYRRATGTRKG